MQFSHSLIAVEAFRYQNALWYCLPFKARNSLGVFNVSYVFNFKVDVLGSPWTEEMMSQEAMRLKV